MAASITGIFDPVEQAALVEAKVVAAYAAVDRSVSWRSVACPLVDSAGVSDQLGRRLLLDVW